MAHEQVHGTKNEGGTGYDPQTKIVVCRVMRQFGYTVCGDGRQPFHTLPRNPPVMS